MGTTRQAKLAPGHALGGYTIYGVGAVDDPKIVEFLEARGRMDIDAITSEDLDAYIAGCKDDGMSPVPSTQEPSALRPCGWPASDARRLPPPCPDQAGTTARRAMVAAAGGPGHCVKGGQPLMADLVLMLVMVGLCVREAPRPGACGTPGSPAGTGRCSRYPAPRRTDRETLSPVFKEALVMVTRSVAWAPWENGWPSCSWDE